MKKQKKSKPVKKVAKVRMHNHIYIVHSAIKRAKDIRSKKGARKGRSKMTFYPSLQLESAVKKSAEKEKQTVSHFVNAVLEKKLL